MLKKIIYTDSSDTALTIFFRLTVGVIFLSEGIQKLFPDIRGPGLVLPSPESLGTFVGIFEIVCGTLILLGLLTRLATIPFFIILVVALTTTKSEIFMNKGFWKILQMLLGCLFLFIKGGGKYSFDWFIMKTKNERN